MNINTLISLFLVFFYFVSPAKAQVLFQENFDNGLPFGAVLINNDNLIPESQLINFNEAWITRPDFNNINFVAASTSWYAPPGQADDWLIFPKFSIGNNTVFSWQARALDANFPDGYEVLISTTGTQISDFSITAFAVAEENTSWTRRSFNLNDFGLANQDIYIAIRNHSIDRFILFIDDILLRNVADNDLSVVDVILPSASCNLTSNEDISVRIANIGVNNLTNFSLNLQVNGLPISNEIFSDTLNANDTILYVFSQTADFSIANMSYDVDVFISLANDADNTNNQKSNQTFHIVPIDVLANSYHTSFENSTERLGWQISDENNDGASWQAFEGNSETGNYAFLYFFNEINAANDWLFSTCFDLVANQAYRLSFKHRVGQSQGSVYTEKLLLMMGATSASAAMTDTIFDFGEINNVAFQNNTFSVFPENSGTYFFGFKAYSDADRFFIAIDDFTFEELLPPSASFTYDAEGLKVSFDSPQGFDNVNELLWEFGDDSTSIARSPEHFYSLPGTYQVCLTVSNVAGSAQFCDSVTVDFNIVGIKEAETTFFQIYPNPVEKQLTIASKHTPSEIVIRDALGRVIWQKASFLKEDVLDISLWPDGFYWIEMTQKKERSIQKLIKISAP